MRLKKSFVIATAAGLALSVVAGCSGASEKAVPTTTTSTTLAIALPADQVSMQGRGTLTLDELGVGWTKVYDQDSGAKFGTCNGPSPDELTSEGRVGAYVASYLHDPPEAKQFTINMAVFSDELKAEEAFARTTESYKCVSWRVELDPYVGNGISVLPSPKLVGDVLARRITVEALSDTLFDCARNQIFRIQDVIEVRVKAVIFRYRLEVPLFSPWFACDGDTSQASPPKTEQLFMLAKRNSDKYMAELKKYTKEVYAALATTTSTTKSKKGSSE